MARDRGARHVCGDCFYLSRTSPEQVFLLCDFWAAPELPVRGAGKAFDRNYTVLHCHVQPNAPACPYFKEREADATP